MLITQMQQILEKLAHKRPIFHSEADFQHALAWEIQSEIQDAQIRLEKPMPLGDSTAYLDLLVRSSTCHIAIELKYKTCKTYFQHGDEAFKLKEQSAQDLGRYDFVTDIKRLENYIKLNNQSEGFAIFLTNDKSYWSEPKINKANDMMYRIHNGKILDGHLAWRVKVPEGTSGSRTNNDIELNGKYTLSWQPYSKVGVSDKDTFKFLLLHIKQSTMA